MKNKEFKKFLLEAPPEDESEPAEAESEDVLDYVLGAMTITAMLILLFVVVPLLFG